jgi:hypothetical protein
METLIDKDKDKSEEVAKGYSDIDGWGIDANPENNPTFPIKKKSEADHEGLNYERAPQQPKSVEVFHSIERPGLTRVFGASVPPQGLSGKLRRYAFKFSEAQSAHWLTLLLADRVNVIEGYIDDFKHGYIPNIFKERGWTAEWKYNRKGVLKNVAIGAAVTTAVIAVIMFKNRSKKMRSSSM